MKSAGRGFLEIGVVEGFYGRIWDPSERERFIEALLPFGLNSYIFCPKDEPSLAARVLDDFTSAERTRLGAFAAFCHDKKVAPWAGLHLEPPLNTADANHLQAVARKCRGLSEAGFTGFVLQFDDLAAVVCPVGPRTESLAVLQAHAVESVREKAVSLGVEAAWVTVPGLYTLDPELQRAFGPFEPDYLARLDEGMTAEIAMMWTGPRVCSPSIGQEQLAAWRGDSQREVLLWDNHPVNDAEMIHHLHLSPLTGRAAELPRAIRGYFFNPLLQPALGAIPGATCLAYGRDPAGYDPVRAWQAALEAFLPPSVRAAFTELEALTRSSSLAEFLPDGSYPGGEPLATRLKNCWPALRDGLRKGEQPDERPGEELAAVLATLGAELPAAMLEEAAPWLERLGHARGLLTANPSAYGLPPRSQSLEAFRQGQARVLGDWFDP